MNHNGTPVSREVRAIKDIESAGSTYVVCGNWLVLNDAETIWINASPDGLALYYTRYGTLIDTLVPVT